MFPQGRKEMGQALFFSALIYSSPFSCLPTTLPTLRILRVLVSLIKSCALTLPRLVFICVLFVSAFPQAKGGDYFTCC